MSTMFDRLMQSVVPVLPPRQALAQSLAPPPPLQPDYAKLIDVLERLIQIPDGLGETTLRPEEAAAIRRCGFAARAGTIWRCPLLPHELVSWNPLLAHLSDRIDPLNRPDGWKMKRAPSRLASQFWPMSRVERKIMGHLGKEPYYMSKRRLQQKLWRYPARFFNRTISRMVMNGTITLYGGLLFPYNHKTFSEMFNHHLPTSKPRQAAVTRSEDQ